MKGHIRKHGAGYSYKHELPRDPITGKRRSKERGGFRTKREAHIALSESLAKLRNGQLVDDEATTVAQYLREWLPRYEATVRPTTAARARSQIEQRIIPGIGHRRLQELRPQHLEDYYLVLISGTSGAKALTASSVKTIHAVISRALSDAERHGRILRNPADKAKTPKDNRPSKEREWWGAEEAHKFLAAMAGHTRHSLWHVALHTGLRRGELLALRWGDIDFGQEFLAVRRQLVAASHEGAYMDPKSAAGRRRVSLDEGTVEVLKRHQIEQAIRKIEAGALWEDGDLVFCADDGRPFLPRSVSAWLNKDVNRCGCRATRLHDLRHCHASMAMQAGISPKVVQERLGHADVALTLRTYSHVMPGMQRDAADQIAALIDAASST